MSRKKKSRARKLQAAYRRKKGSSEIAAAVSDTLQADGNGIVDTGSHPAVIDPPRRRTKEERGLPTDDMLRELAQTYLEVQSRLWPELRVKELLLPRNDESVAILIADFKRRFLTSDPVRQLAAPAGVNWELAAAYARYSDPKSNPRSLSQQLLLMLERAKNNGHFIPWDYVFADAGVSATTSARHGYQKAKGLVDQKYGNITTIYIDEVGRASRDMIESLLLGQLVDKSGKRLIGVSDGFDTAMPMWKFVLSMLAAWNEYFIDQLRSKVNRGMDDTFDRGGNLHPVAFGYRSIPMVDERGRPITGKDGEQLNTREINKKEAKWVLMAFKWYVEKNWTPGKIAREFNARHAGGRTNWDGPVVRQLLRRHAYVGIRVFRTRYYTRHRESGKIETHKRPRKEWRACRARELQIIPYPLWKVTQKRMDVCSDAWAKSRADGPRRCELRPTSLFRPFCQHCGSVLHCGKTNTYRSYWCPNGAKVKKGCPAKGYKSGIIIESALLGHLREVLLSPENVTRLVAMVNIALEQLSAAPRVNTRPIEREMRREQGMVERYHALFASGADVESTARHLRHHEGNLKNLRHRLAEAKLQNAPVPSPLTLEDLGPVVEDLRQLLNEEPATAAPLLKELTGPISIEQRLENGQEKAIWYASFKVNTVPVLARLAGLKDYRATGALEYLAHRSAIHPPEVLVRVDYALPAQQIQDEVLQAIAKGTSINAIANSRGMSWGAVMAIKRASAAGKTVAFEMQKTRELRWQTLPKYIQHATEIARLHEQEDLSFVEIGKRLGMHSSTVARGYNLHSPEALNAAVQNGTGVRRHRGPKLSQATYLKIGDLIQAGNRDIKGIAKEAGCSEPTVRREMEKRGISFTKPKASPKIQRPKKIRNRPAALVAKVVTAHDNEGLSFSEIARRLKVCYGTVHKAYDLGRPDVLAAAVAAGEPPRRSSRSRLGDRRKGKIREMLSAGQTATRITAATGCSRNSVAREKLAYLRELIRTREPDTTTTQIAERCGCRESTVLKEIDKCRN